MSSDDQKYETALMRDVTKLGSEIIDCLFYSVIIIGIIVGLVFVGLMFGAQIADYINYDLLKNERQSYGTVMAASPKAPMKPISLYASFAICTSPTVCLDTSGVLEDGVFKLSTHESKLAFNAAYYIQTSNGTFLPSIDNFCKDNVCFDRDNDVVYLSVSAANSRTYLDSKGTVFINDAIVHDPFYTDINKDGFTEFVYPIDLTLKRMSGDENLHFRILGIDAVDKQFKPSVSEVSEK